MADNLSSLRSSLHGRRPGLLTQLNSDWLNGETNGGKSTGKALILYMYLVLRSVLRYDWLFDLQKFHDYEGKMSNQKKISSFFNSSGTKRRADDADVSADSPQTKSSKTDHSSPDSSLKQPLSNLSPEQRERMEANRKKALEKLQANKSPQFFGDSWRKALTAEFSKEYFVKVCMINEQTQDSFN